MTPSPQKQQINNFTIFTLTILSAYFHVFMEWLFFVTKPSHLSTQSLFEKAKVLIVSGGVFALLLVAGLIVFSIPAWLAGNSKWKARFAKLRFVPSALMLSITALILLDNFTYTLFKFGIITTLGAWRTIYILIFILTFRWMYRFSQRTVPTLQKPASALSLSLLALSLIGILATTFSRSTNMESSDTSESHALNEQPNIIILSADGLSANYLSLYGYYRETTPFLSKLAKTSLLAENAFPNASSTTASTTSALTGKEPASVNVYRYPDILSDEDSFEHLPGILKHQGYQTVQIGTSYYVDAGQLNLLDGFDIVNNRPVKQPALDALRAVLGNSPSTYFIQTTAARATERLLHIFFLQDMKNPFAEVNNPKVRMTDTQRVDQIISLLEESERPLFIFAHFMDTHGPNFSAGNDISTTTTNNEEKWDTGRYEAAIQSFDGHVRDIYSYLERSGELDNTILVIYTDHGYRYVVNQRVPILIHFPKDEHAGRRRNNVQVIDIPATLLDYLGITRPAWMTGSSVLSDEPPADRKIISIVAGSPRKIAPPFYQIKTVQVIVCQKWYTLNVQENEWKSGLIRCHTAPCAERTLPLDSDIRQWILEYLEYHGYETGSLQ